MQETTFFPGAVRRVVLGPPTMLLGANKSRRIRISIKMPLTGEAVLGMPDWLGDAYTAVAKNFTEVEPQLKELIDQSVAFQDTAPKKELFEHPDAKAPSSELRGFKVLRVGESENPDVELQFQIYCAFSRDFWKWCGEKAGDEVHMFFPATKTGISVVGPKLPLDGAPADGEIQDAEFTDVARDPSLTEAFGAGAEPPAAKPKNGAKSLKEFHEKETAKGKASKPGVQSKRSPGARNSLAVN